MTLEEAGVQLIDCVHKTPPAADAGIPYIGIPQMKAGRIDFNADPRLITEDHFQEWTRKANPQENDVVLSRRCNPGETAHVTKSAKFALGQNLVLLRSIGEVVHPQFLRWLTQGPQWWAEIGKYLNVGAVFDSLRCADIPNFSVTIPPIEEQKAIAHILGTLDDKIELNRQMNATLEAMAQALFKSWFVDFDPVIDNALAAGNPIPEPLQQRAEARKALGNQRRPLPDAIQQQFPGCFAFKEDIGWVPEGWEIGPVSRFAELNPESWTNKKHPEDVEYVDLANTKNGRISDTVRYSFAKAPSRARRVLKPDDTIIGTVRPGNRSFAFIQNDGLTGSTGFAVMRPKRTVSRCFVYLALSNNEVIKNFAHLADGAAYPAIRPEVVAGHLVVTPNNEILEQFDSLVYQWLKQVAQQEHMSGTLSRIRDKLLPKLLSGQLRIPDAEKQLAEAGL